MGAARGCCNLWGGGKEALIRKVTCDYKAEGSGRSSRELWEDGPRQKEQGIPWARSMSMPACSRNSKARRGEVRVRVCKGADSLQRALSTVPRILLCSLGDGSHAGC